MLVRDLLKIFNSICVVLLIIWMVLLSAEVDKLKIQRVVDRQLLNGVGAAVIQLMEKQNNETY